MAYRGYALGAAQLLGAGPWLAAVLSSVAFGVLHAYQGTLGTVRTAATGFVLALPVLMTGSIVPAMVAHTLIDLFGGLVLGPQMIDAVGAKSEDSTSDTASVPLVQPDPRE
jgi:membrane protease YdiL (CAAX protease family)